MMGRCYGLEATEVATGTCLHSPGICICESRRIGDSGFKTPWDRTSGLIISDICKGSIFQSSEPIGYKGA